MNRYIRDYGVRKRVSSKKKAGQVGCPADIHQ